MYLTSRGPLKIDVCLIILCLFYVYFCFCFCFVLFWGERYGHPWPTKEKLKREDEENIMLVHEFHFHLGRKEKKAPKKRRHMYLRNCEMKPP